jgi:hypothetical protein
MNPTINTELLGGQSMNFEIAPVQKIEEQQDTKTSR